MEYYVGLDVSLKQTAICVVDGDCEVVWQGKHNGTQILPDRRVIGASGCGTGCEGRKRMMI